MEKQRWNKPERRYTFQAALPLYNAVDLATAQTPTTNPCHLEPSLDGGSDTASRDRAVFDIWERVKVQPSCLGGVIRQLYAARLLCHTLRSKLPSDSIGLHRRLRRQLNVLPIEPGNMRV